MKKKIPIIIAIVFVVLLVISVSGVVFAKKQETERADNYDTKVAEADSFYIDREYSEALKIYTEATEIDPSQSDAYYGIVSVLLDKGLVEKSIEVIESSEEYLSNSDLAELNRQVGDQYSLFSDWKTAFTFYKKALEYDDSNERVVDSYALGLLKLGKVDEVGSIADKASEDNTNIALWKKYKEISTDEELELLIVLEGVQEFVNNGLPYLGIVALESRSDLITENWEAHYYLAKAYFDTVQYDKARESVELAMLLGSEDPGLYLLLARLDYLDNELNTSYSNYDKAFLFSKSEFKDIVGAEFSSILIENEDYAKALSIATPAKDEELSTWSMITLLQVYIHDENFEKVDELIESNDNALDTNDEYLILLSEYYLKHEKLDLAAESIALIKSLNIYSPEYYYLQAKLNLLKDNQEDALLNLEKAIEYDLDSSVTEESKRLLKEIQG